MPEEFFEGMTLGDHMDYNKAILSDGRDKFQRIFGIALTRFMHPIFGFDIIRFDQWLCVPDGISTQDYIIDKYDNKALELVKSLL